MSQDIRAEMGAIVVRVLAGVGTSVAPSDDVLILESMKMEIPVAAEVAGVIREVRVGEGDSVKEGDVLFIVE